MNAPSAKNRRTAMPRTVVALGVVSLFTDISSEIIHGLLPLFLTVTLGASAATVGLIDGIAEATASISKIFSGYISDRMGRRKPLILLGYGMAALTKPLFAVASSAGLVLGARFADRIGKGLRGAPRDALIADVTPEAIRGRAFGLRQAMDTVGAFVGPLLAIGLMALFADDMRAVFWVAVIPGAISTLVVLVAVKEPPGPGTGADRPALNREALRALGRPFWLLTGIGVIFTLARFSEAFLVLRATQMGLPLVLAPTVLVAMNIVYSLGAYPAGILSDRLRPSSLLSIGLLCLIAADALLAVSAGLVTVFAGILLWGAHMALTQGLFAKMVSDRAPAHLRGTAFGMFNLLTGVALLAASLAAGLLWDHFGAPATFIAGMLISLLSLALVLLERQRGDY